MTQAELQLISLLLQEHFGEIVSRVGTFLIHTGCQPLRVIAKDTDTPLDQVKKALCVLIQHNLVTYQMHKRGFVEYAAQCESCLRMLRSPRYIYTAKTLYGDTGELIVEELLLNGKMTLTAVVKKVADRLTETMEGKDKNDGKSMEYSDVSTTFTQLADTHFVQRCPVVEEKEGTEGRRPPIPSLVMNEKEMFCVPRVVLVGRGKRRRSSDEDEGASQSKRPKKEPDTSQDDGIYWQINTERFHQHFRDQAIISAVSNKMDQTSSEIVRTMLRMSEVTTSSNAAHTQPLSSNEIFRSFPQGYNISKQVLDQYLTLLADDPLEFVGRSGDSGGGMFLINLHKAVATLATANLESIVQERFGSRCARIFRLLLRKRHLEQKQVEDFAMIPAKEAKDMLYKMLSVNLISLQTVANLIERRQSETKENKRLLEKSQRIEAIIASMQATGAEEAQLQEIEEMITAPERQQLESLKRNVNKLDASEIQVDDTIFILESYINSTKARP
ncbi:DNA-directed RNA polymerase III subunit RPC3 isoform X3 [Rana temporaria]|uniref:DNA-directed RNA polymerase III subunit RPC3 isoform X3 n=1 Tax=Rana temporaria TaxID=8407 RepID=UPI001AACFF49|nr:DNA-directed RNA polymerase III subunit RPC3 isoform X3 [Rana temporaria]